MDKPFPTRVEADTEGPAIVITIYAHMYSSTLEITPPEAKRLMDQLKSAVNTIEDSTLCQT